MKMEGGEALGLARDMTRDMTSANRGGSKSPALAGQMGWWIWKRKAN